MLGGGCDRSSGSVPLGGIARLGDFGWFSPFAALCGVGLCLGYALLGACWLVKKCEGDVRTSAYTFISYRVFRGKVASTAEHY
jgi:cytochrome bd-type quinol oxidase subunit 2